ncbi:hypothetical protein KKF61_04045 [Patescibacteria group bacterium]|nr:hypothetical protein [Patescibacteria group bacterium]
MDPTAHIPKEHSSKYKFKLFIQKIAKVIWLLIILIILVQTILIVIKLFNNPPKERMCYDPWMCYDYCEISKQKKCVIPEKRDTSTIKRAWSLMLTGKRNIIEVLNEYQGYCACEISIKDETRTETFYKFYSDNN